CESAVMTTRSASSSLRRRFFWTIASAAIIALISLVAIVAYRTAQRGVLGADDGKPGSDITATAARKADEASDNRPPTDRQAVFRSPQFGYSVSLAGSSWRPWDDLAEVVPEAEWGALADDDGRFLVIPVSLDRLDPRREALDHALLARLGIACPGD